jgi:hypothetical protein
MYQYSISTHIFDVSYRLYLVHLLRDRRYVLYTPKTEYRYTPNTTVHTYQIEHGSCQECLLVTQKNKQIAGFQIATARRKTHNYIEKLKL